MDSSDLTFNRRKVEHIQHALDDANQTSTSSRFSEIGLIHEAIPDLNFADINLDTTRLGQHCKTPFLVSSMTAGHPEAKTINLRIAQAALEQGWAMGVGSQRKQLTDIRHDQEWQEIKKLSHQLTLISNVGLTQLILSTTDDCRRLVDSLGAKALIIHTNPLQEAIQPEGTPQFRGSWQALERLCCEIEVPVIVKEVGCGFSSKTLQRLDGIGIAAVDVSGLGGTHWGRIEGQRADRGSKNHRAATVFADWGINTIQSILAAVELKPHYEIWASGGVRSGLDAAKVLALGAQTVGFAKPIMEQAMIDCESVISFMQFIENELKIALFCTGQPSIYELQRVKPWQWLQKT